MSDAQLRRLEREVVATGLGGPELLLKRVRSGDLPLQRLLYAAVMGDPTCREATDILAGGPDESFWAKYDLPTSALLTKAPSHPSVPLNESLWRAALAATHVAREKLRIDPQQPIWRTLLGVEQELRGPRRGGLMTGLVAIPYVRRAEEATSVGEVRRAVAAELTSWLIRGTDPVAQRETCLGVT